MDSIPLHSCGDIHILHPYLLGHTHKQLPVCTAEPFSWVALGMQQAYAGKRYFFWVLFCLYASSFTSIKLHQPISTTYLFHGNDQVKAKKKKPLLALPPSSSFHVSAENERKGRKSILATCPLSIDHDSKLISCSNHINYRKFLNKQTIFLVIFSDEKKNPLPKEEGAIDADHTPLPAPRWSWENLCLCVW